tara:strand:- start:168 stop:755 length:588 start_codon:yes stop_codon:yes gene_type:complete
MFKIGLTGGIGVGKSSASIFFNKLNIPVYNSDNRAKWLMNHDSTLKDKLISEFGSASYSDGKVNRTYLSNLVFKDSDKLKLINSFVHPYVKSDFEQWILKINAPYVVKEAAILIESGAYKQVDYVLLIQSSLENRLKRVSERDGVNNDDILKRINNQMPEDDKQKLADFVILNDSNLEALELKVNAFHKQILNSL